MRKIAAFALAGLLWAGASPLASAQSAGATAKIGEGQTAKVSAAPVPGAGVLLEIALPGGRTQSFLNLGERPVALSGKPGEAALIVFDIDRDGVDEIFFRGLVPPQTGAVVALRWNAASGEYQPIEFTDDRDRTTKYLVVDAALPVAIDEAGRIEAQHVALRQDGRKSYFVTRYRWTGKGYRQSADN